MQPSDAQALDTRAFEAIILAGGAARRLDGADKSLVEIGGRALIQHVLDAVRGGAASITVVGPRRAGVHGVTWLQEDPPGGGPVAALAAALPRVAADVVVVLAADLPGVAPAVPRLLAAIAGHEAAVLVVDGRRNYLAAAWRVSVLRRQLAAVGRVDGAAARALYAGADIVEITDLDGWSADCDTWEDIERERRTSR